MGEAGTSWEAKRESLVAWFRDLPSVAVAFSGGVDSAVVAQAAYLALGDRAVAVTGVSASLATGEREQAGELARLIGIPQVELRTDEFASSDYLRNAPDRCYHCKTELYSQMERWSRASGHRVFVNGANCDDLGDYRPGLKAASEHSVRSPLVECGFRKDDVRALASEWGLPVWDKPASPCLSSRVAYGEEVTPERLERIDRAEQALRAEGFAVVRVRHHRGDHARLEVESHELPRLVASPLRERIVARLRELGFRFVSIDMEGFRSGSLNALVQLQVGSSVKP